MSALEEYSEWSAELVEMQGSRPLAIDYADAAIESLKCCGNCEHWDWQGCRCDIGVAGSIECIGYDPCHFTPSRWQERALPVGVTG